MKGLTPPEAFQQPQNTHDMHFPGLRSLELAHVNSGLSRPQPRAVLPLLACPLSAGADSSPTPSASAHRADAPDVGNYSQSVIFPGAPVQISTEVSAAQTPTCPSALQQAGEMTLVPEVNADNYNSLRDVRKRSVAPLTFMCRLLFACLVTLNSPVSSSTL